MPTASPRSDSSTISRNTYACTSRRVNPSTLRLAISRTRSDTLMFVRLYSTMNASAPALTMSTTTTMFTTESMLRYVSIVSLENATVATPSMSCSSSARRSRAEAPPRTSASTVEKDGAFSSTRRHASRPTYTTLPT